MEQRTYVFRLEGEDNIEICLDAPQSPLSLDDFRAIVGFCCGLLCSYGEDVDFRELKKLARILSQSGITKYDPS